MCVAHQAPLPVTGVLATAVHESSCMHLAITYASSRVAFPAFRCGAGAWPAVYIS